MKSPAMQKSINPLPARIKVRFDLIYFKRLTQNVIPYYGGWGEVIYEPYLKRKGYMYYKAVNRPRGVLFDDRGVKDTVPYNPWGNYGR